MSTSEIIVKIRLMRELQALAEQTDAEIEVLKDAIKAHMGAQEELRAGEYRVTWKPVEAVRLDTVALRAALPDVYSRFTRKSAARRFCVA